MGKTSEDPEPEQDGGDPTKGRKKRGLLGRLIGGFTTSEQALLSEGEQPVVRGSLASALSLGNLRNLRVDDVAIPKVEIVAIPLDMDKEAIVDVFRIHGFSRVPVFKGTLDHPQGLLLLKDLALTYGFGAAGRFSLKKMLRPILFVPPSMPASTLLQKMQRDRVHMALVIDEYGGVDGLVTIEDLIEVVIGEIEDEHDEDEGAQWKEERAGVYVVQANAPLEDFEAAVGQSLRGGEEDKEIDTLGGLIFLRVGRVPVRGEVVTDESGVEFEVLDADPRRIKRVRVRLAGAGTAGGDARQAEARAAAPKAEDPAGDTMANAEGK